MFSCAWWNNYEMFGFASDDFGNPIAIPVDAWEMAWNWLYTGTLEGSYNHSQYNHSPPIIEQLH